MPDAPPDPALPEPAIVARGLTLRGPWGPVYGPVDLDVPAAGVTVMVCPAGSGRTALSMTLAGRMRPTSGSLTVFGRTRARDIFADAALAGIDELDTVAESVTVGDLVTEQLRWDAKWYRLIRRATDDDVRRVCGPVFGELPLPPRTEFVEELTELDGLLLRIALANTRRPRLLVVGNLEQVTSDQNRDLLVDRLVDLGREQTVLTASVNGVAARPGLREMRVAGVSRAELAGHERGEA
ncbi:MAG: hypothetical protein PGN37_08515 [Mycobacterium kyogaense]|uniref:hypothetical protein n=1 Tax=Mycobacterium kyogaense TaxID=2212479 RepID=UPI002FFAE9AE